MQSLIDFERHLAHVEEDAQRFSAADPFPHLVVDNFLNESCLDSLLAEFPRPDAPLAWRRNDAVEGDAVRQANKLGFSDERQLGPELRRLIWDLHSADCLKWLERVTGIEGLIPDPHLAGGGLHQSLPGAVLAVHADFNRHPRLHLDRRLNLLLFLNPDWQDEWRGHLELWDRQMTHCVQRIAPQLNRCVVFRTTSDSYHGHPDPLACPPGVTRKSIALYYYTSPADQSARDGHGTLWQQRPGDPAPAPQASWLRRVASAVKRRLGSKTD
ncbi:MAG: 2OG-Fe(II) oxygenase [Planctomycetales bacterium]|nr:2OG-Fe(II) oxygenase [Planctomycetales bacterium]